MNAADQIKELENDFAPRAGQKKDTGKPALDLIDPYFWEEVGKVLTSGAFKYSPGNWQRGMAIGKVLGGVLRHILQMLKGEYTDPEWGYSHAAHATCGLMFVFWYVKQGMTNIPDDRFRKVLSDEEMIQAINTPPIARPNGRAPIVRPGFRRK